MRATIVEYAHGNSQWRVIHTGLSIFISKVAEILGYADGLLSRYAKRILEIAKCLLNQIEMNARDGIKRRCPAKGSRETYLLDNMVDVVNAELTA